MKKSAALGATVILAVSACAAAPAKDGGPARPLTLSAVSYTTNALAGDTLSTFEDALRASSSGSLDVTTGPALDPGAQDGSADVIRMVRDGSVDIGVVAARTFDLEGATSVQALSLPLVIEDPAQAVALLADPVTTSMLAGLDRAGVVGLALTYDQMRQPLGFAGALTPERLSGARILARPSAAAALVLQTMGATADPRNGDAADAAIVSGVVTGAETSMDRPSGLQSGAAGSTSAVTGNVQLAIKANVIIANPRMWAGLSAAQKDLLRAAATRTRDWAASQAVPLASAAKSFCDNHIGDVVIAGDEELTRWRAAVAPAIERLTSADPVTAEAFARMKTIVSQRPSHDIPAACRVAPATRMPSVTASGDQSAVVGQWRLLVSAEKLAAAGASQQDVGLNQGTWTITLHPGGTYSYVEPRGRSCPGVYAVAGDRLSLQEDVSVGDCDGQWELTFRREGDRMVWAPTPEFLATYPPLAGFFANPLERIAGA